MKEVTKYVSDVTGKTYDSVEDLQKDEEKAVAVKKKDTEREKAYNEVKAAWQKVVDARKAAIDLTNKFTDKYKGFYLTIRHPLDFNSFFSDDDFFNWF